MEQCAKASNSWGGSTVWNGIQARLVLHCLLFLLSPCLSGGTLNQTHFGISTGAIPKHPLRSLSELN